MGLHVEASSLSDITQLAGNPPKYPRNPTEPRRQPLTLYIARVPGSRDIILTTLKPQLKNVTAEDVAASLYYLHLNTEDDVRFLKDNDEAGIITEEREPNLQKPLPRKPLPESARSSLDVARSPGVSNSLASIPKRKPLMAEASVIEPRQSQLNSEPTIPRRPLGPRALGPEATVTKDSLPGVENVRPESVSRRKDVLPPLHTSGKNGESLSSLGDMTNDGHLNDFSITLIRRDPSSGAQWNVGIITGRPLPGEAQNRRGKSSKKPYFEMSIHLSTPGYNRFRSPSPTGPIARGMTKEPMPVGASREGETSPLQTRSDSGFSRQLRMEGSNFWARSSMHKRTQSDMSGERVFSRDTDPTGYSPVEGANAPRNDSNSTGAVDPQSKGYTFQSLWGGTCKFTTGSGGRTLRCKHSLPAPISAKTAGDFTSAPQPPSIVSELRFNLPSTTIFAPSPGPDATTKRSSVDSGRFNISKFGHIRNKLSADKKRPVLPPRPHPTSYAALYPSDNEEPPPLPPRTPTTSHLRPGNQQTSSFLSNDTVPFETKVSFSDEADDEDRLDLSIGREKAGGGNRGKRAKLGKLIIHDEGLKMLDLVIAANMGIWWSVWEFDNR